MTVTDAGPLIALLDTGESDHDACVAALGSLQPPLVTTWPALTEAMYLLGRNSGWTGQERLWRLIQRRDLVVRDLDGALVERTHHLMERYRDLPMALADASLISLADSLRTRRVFTLDARFRIYRSGTGQAFEIVP
ncbi:MAG: PIN domain-containing protein [Chloroflexota bacterium]|nr:MAG: PIN domain-containing protein [Chloroflexota bacterium]